MVPEACSEQLTSAQNQGLSISFRGLPRMTGHPTPPPTSDPTFQRSTMGRGLGRHTNVQNGSLAAEHISDLSHIRLKSNPCKYTGLANCVKCTISR